jgi:hypothetical protein
MYAGHSWLVSEASRGRVTIQNYAPLLLWLQVVLFAGLQYSSHLSWRSLRMCAASLMNLYLI